jgi:XTP/dITP diphosphohydrolase
MTKLLLATTNQGKVSEFRFMLQGLPFDLVTPEDEDLDCEVEEIYDTYEENAWHKATSYAIYSNLITLADDSGLEVDALDGAPGVYSARYAGPGATDKERVNLLLRNLNSIPQEKRTACFKCVIAVAVPGKITETFEGECSGYILLEPKGENGFGYDPVFYFPEHKKSMAELSSDVKNRISHRAKAAQKAYYMLEHVVTRVKKR